MLVYHFRDEDYSIEIFLGEKQTFGREADVSEQRS